MSMVFIPDAPRYDAGEMRVVASSNIKKLDISIKNFVKAQCVIALGLY